MDMEKLAKIKELAKRADAGPWHTEKGTFTERLWICRESDGSVSIGQMWNARNSEYMAAVSPDVILELIEDYEALAGEDVE